MRATTHFALAASLAATLAACAGPSTHESVADAEPRQDLGLITARPVAGWDVFGGDVSATTPKPADALVAEADLYDGQTVVVEGTVDSVCVKKGCWMIMKAGDEDVRVRFEDYAFFVPFESAGRTARIEGVFSIVETSAADVRHYLEDAGKHEEAAAVTGPQREFLVMATGVRMKD